MMIIEALGRSSWPLFLAGEWTQADANIKLRLRGRLEEMSGVKDWQEVEFGAK